MSLPFDVLYKNLLGRVLQGRPSQSRAGETRRIFATSLDVTDLQDGFPALTLRRLHFKGIFGELAAFITGTTRLQDFKDFGCNYWDANAAAWPMNRHFQPESHVVGEVYGYQWRHWGGKLDQLHHLIEGLKQDPAGRRHLLMSYNPTAHACLPACHIVSQFYVDDIYLDCCVTMRSVDVILGLPSDIILYATLQHLIGLECNLIPRRLVFNMGDTHIYTDHMEGAYTMLQRPLNHLIPMLDLSLSCSLFNFKPSHVKVVNYEPQPSIAGLALNV